MKITDIYKKIKNFLQGRKRLPEGSDEKRKVTQVTEEEFDSSFMDEKKRINITDKPMRPTNSELRQDKGVSIYLKNEGDQLKNTSSVMLGYNNEGFILPCGDGDYVKDDEILEGLQRYINDKTANETTPNAVTKIIEKGSNNEIDVDKLLEKVRKAVNKQHEIEIGEGSSKIQNQDTVSISVRDKSRKEYIKKGLLFLGKGGMLALPSGDYISITEMESELKNYLFRIENVIEVPIVKNGYRNKQKIHIKGNEENKKGDEDDEKKRCVLWPLILTSIATIALGIKLDEKMVPQEKTVIEEGKKVEKTKVNVASEGKYNFQEENLEQIVERICQNIETGEKINIDAGIVYSHESDYELFDSPIQAEFGENSIRNPGIYKLEYISILDNDNNIVQVETEEGITLEQVLEDAKLKYEDAKIRFHIARRGEIAGWIDGNRYIGESKMSEPQVIDSYYEPGKGYETVVEDYRGKIEVTTDSGRVTISTGGRDNIGKFVIGSDGNKYQVQNIEDIVEQLPDETKVITENIHDGYSITWSLKELLHKVPLPLVFIGMGLIGSIILSERKNEDLSEKNIDDER